MKTTYLLSFDFRQAFFKLQVYKLTKEKLLIDIFSLFPCLCVSMLSRNQKLKSKVIFIVLIILHTTTLSLGYLIPGIPQDWTVSTKHLIRRVKWNYIHSRRMSCVFRSTLVDPTLITIIRI